MPTVCHIDNPYSKLRLKYYKDRTPLGAPDPPSADFAYNWNGYIEVSMIIDAFAAAILSRFKSRYRLHTRIEEANQFFAG